MDPHTPEADVVVASLIDADLDLAPVLPTLIAGHACDAFPAQAGWPGGLTAERLSMLAQAVVGVHEVVEASPCVRDALGPARWLWLMAEAAQSPDNDG